MNVPLSYQISEYDCGPVSLLNAVSFLFPQAEIPPEVIRSILLYSLDGYDAQGASGKTGTSATAMMFLSNWLTAYGQTGRLSVSCRYLAGEQVFFDQGSPICEALERGGAVVQRLYLEVGHYVLLTGLQGKNVLAFDPYYWEKPFADPDIRIITDRPFACNRLLPFRVLNSPSKDPYALGPVELREAVILVNDSKTTPKSGGIQP